MLPGGVGNASINADGFALKKSIISSQSLSFFVVVFVLSCFILLLSDEIKDFPIFVFFKPKDDVEIAPAKGFLIFEPNFYFYTILDEAEVVYCFSLFIMKAFTLKGSIKLF